MVCQSCFSSYRSEFSAEINIHFPGSEGLSKPSVLVFPALRVCLKCGSAEFAISGAPLRALADGIDEAPAKIA